MSGSYTEGHTKTYFLVIRVKDVDWKKTGKFTEGSRTGKKCI